MYKLVCFIQYIDTELPKIYSIYSGLVDSNLVISPKVYTDKCDLLLNDNISILHTYYIRQHFSNDLILTDYHDFEFVPEYMKKKCIVLYEKFLPDNITRACFLSIKYDNNTGEKINAKLQQLNR